MGLFINEFIDAGTTELHDIAEEFICDTEQDGNEPKIQVEITNRGYKYHLLVKFAT